MLTLLTIPASHYCEKARWALDRAGIEYRESGHAPLLSRLAGRWRGVWSSVPILFTPEGPVPDSTAILQWIDERTPAVRRLYPSEPAARAEVDVWEDLFDDSLGPHTRRLAYGWLLPQRKVALAVVGRQRIPRFEKLSARLFFPVFRAILRRGMKIDAAGMTRSIDAAEAVFARVSERVRDHAYLAGDRFSAADLTFASLAAPVLLPPEYGAPLPALDDIPGDARATVERLRATPAGAFALRIYREQRRVCATPIRRE